MARCRKEFERKIYEKAKRRRDEMMAARGGGAKGGAPVQLLLLLLLLLQNRERLPRRPVVATGTRNYKLPRRRR